MKKNTKVKKIKIGGRKTNNSLNTMAAMSSTPPIFCEICKIKLVEHIHHKDENHKNNKPENLQGVCTLCHAKIHGIEPRFSEIRRLVTLYTRTQKARMALANQIRGFSGIELKIPDSMINALENFENDEKEIEKQIKNMLEPKTKKVKKKKVEEVDQLTIVNNDHQRNVEPSAINKILSGVDHVKDENHKYFVEPDSSKNNGNGQVNQQVIEHHEVNVERPFAIYPWLKSHHGISHLLAAKIIAYVDISKTPSQAALRQYAGWGDPMDKKRKGYKIKHNPTLKTFFYQLAESFIKQGKEHSYVKDFYRPHKAKQLKLFRKMKAEGTLDKKHRDRGHSHARAMRFMIKVFINNLYQQMVKCKNGNVDLRCDEHHSPIVEPTILLDNVIA